MIVVAAIVVLPGILVGRAFPAWREWTTAGAERRERASHELARIEEAIDGAAALRDSLIARNARYLALAPGLLPGGTPGGAGASLAALVSGAAVGSGLRIGAVHVRSDTVPASVFSRVTARGDAHGDITGLTRFLAAIERGPALLVVRQASITQRDPSAPQERAEELRLEFVIEGIGIAGNRDRSREGRGDRGPSSPDSASQGPS